ncbi:hydrogenase assembly protein HypC [Candidatus Desantisbacteria bacterium CG1_02_38_46]|uniref:HypC/HybG/HupF family hydrogenase formation chaperone n=2 Tax=unclassified Candidatus Desantisiibacteriota TaxID=3106372 RepID=A0A2H9PC09_9BACT|nr:MAG: hydrogenase assembly protein HypC [Candidatus Desantisbacteria bacterium CG1_02_38_46]PIZ16539.1 MAG: HypC/HybG/HupF family hydrogenase formation chaperone [Candidatus Desantisbacteria bacterium CG_4_10_14_0_8_um_filter_39_17]
MCLAVPVKVVKITGDTATINAGGVLKDISILLLQGVKAGDYVLLHAGFAIQKIDEKEANETLKIIYEAGLLDS